VGARSQRACRWGNPTRAARCSCRAPPTPLLWHSHDSTTFLRVCPSSRRGGATKGDLKELCARVGAGLCGTREGNGCTEQVPGLAWENCRDLRSRSQLRMRRAACLAAHKRPGRRAWLSMQGGCGASGRRRGTQAYASRATASKASPYLCCTAATVTRPPCCRVSNVRTAPALGWAASGGRPASSCTDRHDSERQVPLGWLHHLAHSRGSIAFRRCLIWRQLLYRELP